MKKEERENVDCMNCEGCNCRNCIKFEGMFWCPKCYYFHSELGCMWEDVYFEDIINLMIFYLC